MNTKNTMNTMNMTQKSKANTHTRYTPVVLVGPIHQLNRITKACVAMHKRDTSKGSTNRHKIAHTAAA
jgi:hypothetical protein